MKISIIVPVYNVSDFVLECLESVAIQNSPGLECIIVDDCGTDDSMEKVASWLESYSGDIAFKVIRNDENQGLSESRNRGLMESTSDYVMFLDSDDTLLPGAVAQLYSVMLSTQADVVLGNCITSKGDTYKMFSDDVPELLDTPEMIQRFYLRYTEAWNKLYRREVVKDVRFKKGILAEDLLFSFRLLKHLRKVACCREVTYNYRIREDSILWDRHVVFFRDKHRILSLIADELGAYAKTLPQSLYVHFITDVWVRDKFDTSEFYPAVRNMFLHQLTHLQFRYALKYLLILPPFNRVYTR